MRSNRFLWPYVGTILLIVLIVGFSTYRDWRSYEQEQTALLIEHAAITATQVDSALLDASRLVDVAQKKFDKEQRIQKISDLEAHNLLKRTVEDFRFSAARHQFGLLFFVDGSGIIRAQNLNYPADHLDVSDRLYFVDALAKSDQPWHVGEQVIARTNHQRVFHYALTLRDSRKKFAGVLLQQIKIDAVPIFHAESRLKSSENIITFQSGGHIAFTEPYPTSPMIEPDLAKDLYLYSTNNTEQRKSGWMKIASRDGSQMFSHYLGYVRSPIFGMTTVATVPTSTIWFDFLKRNTQFILLVLLGIFAISYLFRRLNNESLERESEHSLGLHDPLTNLINRRALDVELPKLIAESRRDGRPISVLFLDIDHFNTFNNTYGHDVGDQVLVAVAQSIQSIVHRPLDLCCRWGGEEFVAVLPNTDESGAWHIAEAIRTNIKEVRLKSVPGNSPVITASVGVVSTSVNAFIRSEDLIKQADKLMYEAKSSGRDCCRSNFPTHSERIT